jgi:hypothetical protein
METNVTGIVEFCSSPSKSNCFCGPPPHIPFHNDINKQQQQLYKQIACIYLYKQTTTMIFRKVALAACKYIQTLFVLAGWLVRLKGFIEKVVEARRLCPPHCLPACGDG